MKRLVASIGLLCLAVMFSGMVAQPSAAQVAPGDHAPARIAALQATVTPIAPPVQPTPQPDGMVTYAIQPGDNLYKIAARFNTTIAALLQANKLTDTKTPPAGTVLIIPPSSAVQSETGNTAGNVGFTVGMSIYPGGAPEMAALVDLGVPWVKLTAYWSQLEPAPDTLDLAALDAQVDALMADGIQVMLTISRAPNWARSTDVDFGPSTDFERFGVFLGKLAGHYKGKVGAYEVWEQPNLAREWRGAPLTGASYVALLRVAHKAIKEADSGALVVTAGLAPTALNDGVNAVADREYLRQMYAAGVASAANAIGAQPDGRANPPDTTCCNAPPGVSGWFNDRTFYFRDTLTDYRQIMLDNKDGGRFLWVTRFGWGSSEGVAVDLTAVNQNLGFVNFTGQEEQAIYTARAIELGRALGYVGPMFLYNLSACSVVGSNSADVGFEPCFYALVNTSGLQRPVYAIVKGARK